MKTFLCLITCVLFLSGCWTPASRMNDVRLGMSRAEVVAIMGQPSSTTADTSAEYLNYSLPEAYSYAGTRTPYEVKLVNGKVVSYGRAGVSRAEARRQTTPTPQPTTH